MEKKAKISKSAEKIIVVIVAAFFFVIGALGLLQKFDFRLYDILLSMRKNPAARAEILLVEVDNPALEEMGPWPWTRDIFADALLRMKELGAATAVFDIEYLSPSNAAVNPALGAELDALFAAEKREVGSAVRELSSAVYRGDFSVRDLPELSEETLAYIVNPSLDKLRADVAERASSDYDGYFARAIQFFGDTWLTINCSDLDISYTPEYLDYVKKRFLFPVEDAAGRIEDGNRRSLVETMRTSVLDEWNFSSIKWDDSSVQKKYLVGFSPALERFMTHAEGAGFTNVVIDADGTRRRVELLHKEGDDCVAQLALAPLLKVLAPEKIVREKSKLRLVGAHIPASGADSGASGAGEETVRDIVIPLDKYGRMLVNWKHEGYAESFRHESVLFLALLARTERNIVSLLQNLAGYQWQIPAGNALAYGAAARNLLLDYADITSFKEFLLQKCTGRDGEGFAKNGGIPADELAQYFEARAQFFAAVTEFTNGEYMEEIESFLMDSRDELGEDLFRELAAGFTDVFGTLKNEISVYNADFADMKNTYAGKVCIIGNTASSTTDLGSTPFERSYPNVGTHANIYNTIMNGDFITPVPFGWGALFAAALTVLVIWLTAGRAAFVQNAAGIGLVAFVALVPVLLMAAAGVYVPAVAPFLIAFSTYLAVTVLRFVNSERDKKFLQNTFGAYVAPSVVEEIVKNPDVAKLGGKTDYITALFSDVATFSGFTETINNEEGEDKGAERLVAILNEYLGALSDAIMDNGGTIDKYVGDEIVSFFGAPVPNKDNAFHACVAGIRMLQAEKKYNAENAHKLPKNPKTGEPFYLHSRVGLNTGNMVVGNMGTDKKLNYTIMGNNVNLASRLEGTNKVYGSWIMVSESTWLAANEGENAGKLVAREFDAVRVVNVKKPVRIYNVLGLRDEMSAEQIKAAELFNEGMTWYMNGADTPDEPKDAEDFKKAIALYRQAAELYPDDASSAVFIERCEGFLRDGIPDVWDGVYTMKSK